MDNRQLYQQKMTIGMVYHHELACQLRYLGYELNWNRDGTFDVRGYTPEQLKEFSTRKQEIEKEINQNQSLVKTKDGRLTTQTAIKREKQILHLAKNSKDKYSPLANTEIANKQAQKLGLNKAQASALKHFVNNRDGVILCQGDAGVGKTYTVKAFKKTISSETKMRGLAPSAAAAGELSKGAEINCQTLDAYLSIPIKSLPKNELIVVDEAGTISSSQMKNLLERGQKTNSRILLIGDTKQLAAVQAGSPFKLLQDKAKLPTIRIDENVRQQNIQLKEVVDLLSAGEINQGYQKLNEQGSIKQIPIDSLRLKAVVSDYLERDLKT